MDKEAFVKNTAHELGFSDCRFAKADFLAKEAPLFEDWLKKKYNAEMHCWKITSILEWIQEILQQKEKKLTYYF